jgi:hypothetical protein
MSNHAEAAKMIRAELKKNGIAASVRAKSYSGGSSIDVRIEQDLTPAGLKEVEIFCGQFEYGHFDGMTDCYHVSNSRDDIPQVSFVFVRVAYSEKIREAAKAYVATIGGLAEHERDTWVHRAISGADFGHFWRTQKPRVRLGGAA